MQIDATRLWVEEFVVRHNLCPFAAPFLQKIHYRLVEAKALEERLLDLHQELMYLDRSQEHRTSLLIYDDPLLDWDSYLDLLVIAEDLIAEMGWPYQLASFHPQYQFVETEYDDPANKSNRSPYPTIHILRIDDVERAIAQHPDTNQIPLRNIAYLRTLFKE